MILQHLQRAFEAFSHEAYEKVKGYLLDMEIALWSESISGKPPAYRTRWFASKELITVVLGLINEQRYPDALAKMWDLKARLEA